MFSVCPPNGTKRTVYSWSILALWELPHQKKSSVPAFWVFTGGSAESLASVSLACCFLRLLRSHLSGPWTGGDDANSAAGARVLWTKASGQHHQTRPGHRCVSSACRRSQLPGPRYNRGLCRLMGKQIVLLFRCGGGGQIVPPFHALLCRYRNLWCSAPKWGWGGNIRIGISAFPFHGNEAPRSFF